MKMMNSLSRQQIFWIAGFLSLVLSFWISARESVINPDAICYLQSAATMSQGLNAAMHLCGQASWPFYSFLIYGVAQVTHFSYQVSAYSLNGLLALMSVLVFLLIIRSLTTDLKVLAFAAITILFFHEFNSVRQYIVRDQGYFAFYLLSFYFLLQYFREKNLSHAFLWSGSLIIAALFRIEGVIFLFALPLFAFFEKGESFGSRLQSFFKLNILNLVGLGVCVLFYSHLHDSRLQEISFQFFHGGATFYSRYIDLKTALANHVLTPDSVNEAGKVLILMLASWYCFSVITNLSIVYSILVVYAWMNRLLQTDSRTRLVIWGYIVINFFITAGFLVQHLFLSKRYLIALSLIFMIWVPFALENLSQNWRTRRLPFLAAILFIFISSLGGIFDFGYSKKYIHDAGSWLAENVSAQSSLYSNDYQVMYYSHHFGNDIFNVTREFVKPEALANQQWKHYEYLALRVDQKSLADEQSLLSQIDYPLIKVFHNKRNDQIRIYRRNDV